jgi:hypothetical protein
VEQASQGNAVWETEPKEDVGMDLYYEATDAIPMKLNNSNIASFAPINSSIRCEREDSDVNPISLSQSISINLEYKDDKEPTVKHACRDVVALGYDSQKQVFRYPVAIGDKLKFYRPTGMITEATVIDHWHPIKSYHNIQPYTETQAVTSGGGMTVLQDVDIPLQVSTYKTSNVYNVSCSVGNATADGANFFAVNAQTMPEGLRSNDGQIYEVTSSTLSIDHGTFTVRDQAAEGEAPAIFGISTDQGGNYRIKIWNINNGPEQQSIPNGTHIITFKEVTGYYRLDYRTYLSEVTLPWFNCYSFGNGLESDRIRDDFNAPQIDNGVKVSTGLESYKQERREGGLIWSGIYNSTSGVNNLNEFNMAEAITKDLNPSYGSIQALKSRDTNLVTFCEDKVLQILANKDALFNADGSSNVTASNAVLGNAKAFAGDYGISSNPESLVTDAYRMYFTDKQRGKVLRLSQDGLTPISEAGMSTYFRDNLKGADQLIGTFDEVKGEYNLTLKYSDGHRTVNDIESTTVSFSEKVKGWTSFKSFIPETGLSINAEYITAFASAEPTETGLWVHHHKKTNINPDGSEELVVPTNNFYGVQYNSEVEVLFNEQPGSVKGFSAINYEGTQARISKFDFEGEEGFDASGVSLGLFNDNEFYNIEQKNGWYVESFNTDLQESSVVEFIDKENKWFSFIDGIPTNLSNLDTSEFTVQGIGVASDLKLPEIEGCMDPSAMNYNPDATINVGCKYEVLGCTDEFAFNYNPDATVDDDSCEPIVEGCIDPFALNYNVFANTANDALYPCQYAEDIVPGCMDPEANNYNPDANAACEGCCTYDVEGCTDPTAINFNPLATIDDGSCQSHINGCTDPIANNFNPIATVGNPHANDCTYDSGCMDPDAWNYNTDAVTEEGCTPVAPEDWLLVQNGTITNACCMPYVKGCTDSTALNYNPLANTDDGSCFYEVLGCTDPAANNYNPDANVDDGSCKYPSAKIILTEENTHNPPN